MNDVDDRWNKMIESGNKIIQILGEMILQQKQEKTIPLCDIISQLPPSIVIATSPFVLPIEDPEDSLIMRNEDLNTIPKKESDEVIMSSVKDHVSIPSESEDTSESDSECDLPSCDDISPIDIPEGKTDLSTILKKESDEVIKSSVEDLVPILSESEDTSGSDSECILPSSDDFSSINVIEEKSMTFSNPFFNSNDDFTSSDDESLSDE
nr:hypothetical protein [Tanacetum cinerariifolium]GEZ73932.1 hypothetical protein [Tanacetum cinerariifolium]